MRNKIVLWVAGCFMALMTSCLSSSNEYIYEVSRNCQLLSFTLENDSVEGLSTLEFTIDQLGNAVFNLDSMPVGTEIGKVLIDTMTYGSATTGVRIYQTATGDTIDYSNEDSVDFSQPVEILIYTGEAIARKYDAWVNIHTQEPDSLVWKLYSDELLSQPMDEVKVITNSYAEAGEDTYLMYARPVGTQAYLLYTAPMDAPDRWTEQALSGLPTSGLLLEQMTTFNNQLYVPATDGALYASADGATWSRQEGAPMVKALLGGLSNSVNQPAALAAVVEAEGSLVFAAMDVDGSWEMGAGVPAEFPISGFASTDMDLMYRDRLLIVGGRTAGNQLVNTTWSTMDARTWANLTDAQKSYFTKKEGANVAYYDDKFYLIGGMDEAGKPTKDIHLSIDHGVTWSYIDSLVVLPNEYAARGFASMIVDKDNYLCIFGGKTAKTVSVLNEVWRGRINRLGFERQ